MTVDFFINKSDNRYIDKTLQNVITLNNVYLKSDENKETMTLELDYNATVLSVIFVNFLITITSVNQHLESKEYFYHLDVIY